MKTAFLVFCSLLFVSLVSAQITIPRQIRTDSTHELSPLPQGNAVTYMKYDAGALWIGTSSGLGKTTDFGSSWQNYGSNPEFANHGIFSLATNGNVIWTATGYDYESDGGSVQTGSGYTYSTDGGSSWNHRSQALDARGDSIIAYGINDSVWILPIVVPQQNVTFDISISPNYVWIASWSSGLRRSTNNGQTWERILLPLDSKNYLSPYDSLWTFSPYDTLQQRKLWTKFDPRHNNNMLAFSVYTIGDDTIWCGTAGGINKSIDGGMTWTRFSHQNQRRPILGNWVIAIDEQRYNGKDRIWTTNWKANDNTEEYGVSYTEDWGLTWKNLLQGVKAYDFAFKDSIVYIATDVGIYRTEDLGVTFQKYSTFIDPVTRTFLQDKKVYSVVVVDDTVFIGTEDGLVKTIDNSTNEFGSSWKIFRTFQQVGTAASSYAYPNPYSPAVDNVVRIHYGAKDFNAPNTQTREVSIELFDFGMNRVRTLLTKAQRTASAEVDELWDGRDNDGTIVPNGVYFYRLIIDSGDPMYGKILVMQ